MHTTQPLAAHHILHYQAADTAAVTGAAATPGDATPWAWTLARHEATTLSSDGAPRWLHVDDGCVWVTRRDGADLASDRANDIWLAPGDSLALPAGSAWVLEAWPQARLSLLLQAPASVNRAPAAAGLQAPGAWPALGVWLARWWQPSWLRARVSPLVS